MTSPHFLPYFISLNNSLLKNSTAAPVTTGNNAKNPNSFWEQDWFVFVIIFIAGLSGLIYLLNKCFSSQRESEQEEGVNLTVSSQTVSRNRGFDNPYANRCFANALLTCLYHLPGFREQIKQANRRPGYNSILKKVEELVEAIDKSYPDRLIEQKKEEFFEEIMTKNPDNTVFKQNGGDSRFLFQVLCENLYPDKYSNNGYFSFQQEKFVSCEHCLGKAKENALLYTENSVMLNIQEDYYFQKKSPKNYFQPEKEKRMCKNCHKHTNHVKQLSLESFPRILAIRIGDNLDYDPPGDPSPHLSLMIGPKGKERNLKFLAGVYNTNRGYRGEHSVAYVRTNEGYFRCFNDSSVFSVGKNRIKGYPKLLFYMEEDSSRQIDYDLFSEF